MIKKPKLLTTYLLLTTFLLAWAGTAVARDIIVEFSQATLSSLAVATDGNDTILVRNGGSLLVDVNATIATLTIGDATSSGGVSFPQSVGLTVKGNVVFGSDPLNILDMSVSLTTPVLQVGGNFLSSGAGIFRAGSGTVEYNGTGTQSVTGNIGGSGGTIQYKHLTLSGNPSGDNRATKNFAAGVSVQGTLTIRQKAVLSGPSVTYGALGALLYSGSVPQTATSTEWPATLNIPVQIADAVQVTLNENKTLGPVFPNSLTLMGPGSVLKDGGFILTVQGGINNAGSIQGKGQVVLSGSANQTLIGTGNYGNVTLNNGAGATLPGSAVSVGTLLFNGRLIIQNGRVTLPYGTTHIASLLTFGSADKIDASYTAANSPSAFANPSGSGTPGVLQVPVKPTAVVTVTNNPVTISYGDASVAVGGTLKPPTGTPDFEAYGNVALTSEQVTITILRLGTPLVSVITSPNDGRYLATLATDALASGDYDLTINYAGGINLKGTILSLAAGLKVNQRTITVTPQDVSKTYGTIDPDLPFTYAPALVGSDIFTGKLSRLQAGQPGGENAGTYGVTQGTLYLDPQKYNLVVATGKLLTILKKPITVLVDNASKVYGNPDPTFTYTYSPSLIPGDNFSGALGRDAGNENVGSYPIKKGTLTVLPGDNYQLNLSSANLTITTRPVTVVFDNAAKIYGEADPAFTWITTPGLVGSDAWNSTLSGNNQGKPSRVTGETVASSPYTIQQGNLSILQSNNYSVTWTTTGKLAINKKDVTVNARVQSREYGASVSVPNNLVTYVGFLASGNPAGVPAQTAPATTVPTLNPATPMNQCSVPNVYNFTVTGAGSDPNYNMVLGTAAGSVTVTPKPISIIADNKSKVANGSPFDPTGFSVTYNSFTCSDTAANSFSGTLQYTGDAIGKTAPGVYQIVPGNLTSTKYNITFVPGWLSITEGPVTNSITGDLVWGGTGEQSRTFFFSHANGAPGKDPGWTLLKVSGNLVVNATPASPFRIDLSTVVGGTSGRMAKFDPTRPYSWEIAQASAISGFTSDKFTVNYNGPGLFVNPVFGGKFSVSQQGTSLFLNYAPMGAPGNTPIPDTYTVGSLADTATLLGDVAHSDIDVLYAEATKTSMTALETVTVNLNVANLKQAIVGVEAYINFDSRFFIANATGAGAPVVQAGGGVWDTVIYKIVNTGGDLDTVLAVSLNNATGSSADGTVGKITLTPTKTATGKSRIVFRQDGALRIEEGTLTNSFTSVIPGAPQILPARVMSETISIAVDNTGPVLTSYAATQVQPHLSTPVNVRNGNLANRTETVRTTGGTAATDSGPVIVTIVASDAGVGLSGPPTLTLKKSGSTDIIIPCTNPTQKVGPFTYNWNVPANVDNGRWTASVTATDTIQPTPNSTTKSDAFTVDINTLEVNGVVELQSFRGTNRIVTFKAGDGNGTTTTDVKSWDLNLNFISGPILNAGAWQNRESMANKIKAPADPLSAYLRGGDILNLQGLATKLNGKADGVSVWLDRQFNGYITDLKALAATLKAATRSVDVYILDNLSDGTLAALAAYNPTTGAGGPALTAGILHDYTTIVVGPSIYDPVRFASVPLSAGTLALLAIPEPTADDIIALNRSLLHDAYVQYFPGQLDANTAQRLAHYTSGDDSTLMYGLLAAFDTLTVSPSMWPPATPPFVQCLYNEQVFLGVPLSSATADLLESNPTGNNLTLLNQLLLQDAYAGLFVKAPLTPATVVAVNTFDKNSPSSITAFDAGMQTDLNALINGGVSIYTPARFAPWVDAIDPNSELGKLLANPSPTPAELVRENRLLLELAYDAELSKSVLAAYRLVSVPSGSTEISAKTAWNLRLRSTMGSTINWVNNGIPQWQGGLDRYLRAGDITGDNGINLSDYNVLRINYGSSAGAAADMNGDGLVNIFDYSLLQVNWAKSGDADVR